MRRERLAGARRSAVPWAEVAKGRTRVVAAAGRYGVEALDALAAAVLASEPVRLALAIQEGGPLAVGRAIELAALVLAAPVTLGESPDAHARLLGGR